MCKIPFALALLFLNQISSNSKASETHASDYPLLKPRPKAEAL